jgi:hypothetical protein
MTKTYIATNKPDKVILVEDGEISHAINPNCNEWADYEAYLAEGNQLIEPQPSEAHVFMQGAWVLDEKELDRLRLNKREELKQERDAKIAEPINNVQVGRFEDRENIKDAIRKWEALGNPATITWIMYDNTTAQLSKQDLINIEDAYVGRQLQVFAEYQSLCEQLAVSDDPESIIWS